MNQFIIFYSLSRRRCLLFNFFQSFFFFGYRTNFLNLYPNSLHSHKRLLRALRGFRAFFPISETSAHSHW
jgi:hypothetical protein